MIQEIYIIDDDESSIIVFRELFKNDPEYKFISVTSDQIDIALKNIPSIIIINEDAIEVNVLNLCKKIRPCHVTESKTFEPDYLFWSPPSVSGDAFEPDYLFWSPLSVSGDTFEVLSLLFII